MRGMKGEIGDGIPDDLDLVLCDRFPSHWRTMVQPSSMGIACYLAGRVAHDCASLMRRALLAGQTKRQQVWALRLVAR